MKNSPSLTNHSNHSDGGDSVPLVSGSMNAKKKDLALVVTTTPSPTDGRAVLRSNRNNNSNNPPPPLLSLPWTDVAGSLRLTGTTGMTLTPQLNTTGSTNTTTTSTTPVLTTTSKSPSCSSSANGGNNNTKIRTPNHTFRNKNHLLTILSSRQQHCWLWMTFVSCCILTCTVVVWHSLQHSSSSSGGTGGGGTRHTHHSDKSNPETWDPTFAAWHLLSDWIHQQQQQRQQHDQQHEQRQHGRREAEPNSLEQPETDEVRNSNINVVMNNRPAEPYPAIAHHDQVHTVSSVSDTATLNQTACTVINSVEWLKASNRLGNLWDERMAESNFIQSILISSPYVLQPDDGQVAAARSILALSVAHKDSHFLNLSHPSSTVLDKYRSSNDHHVRDHDHDDDVDHMSDPLIRQWAVRLAFWSIHWHQHRAAIPEAVSRLQQGPACIAHLQQQHHVGPFDYECSGTKFIVTSLNSNGLGINIRGAIVPALMLGMVTNRTVLVLNHAHAKHAKATWLRASWPLASCDRHDMQCFFMPLSPCVITTTQLEQHAVLLERGLFRGVLSGRTKISAALNNAPIWVLVSPGMPQTIVPVAWGQALSRTAHALIDQATVQQQQQQEVNLVDPRFVRLLRLAADSLSRQDTNRVEYHFAAATLRQQHALAIYGMRPNIHSANQIQTLMQDIIPTKYNPETSLGLPVRGSDKCNYESQCLTFEEHMQAVTDFWRIHVNHTMKDGTNNNLTILFTTEAKSVVQEQKDFVVKQAHQWSTTNQSNSSNSSRRDVHRPFRFDFVTNQYDVTPDTGFLKVKARNGDVTADDAMLSAMTSLQLQLHAAVTVGNCCSNFHVLLSDLLMEGLGAAPNNTFWCLQQAPDPALRICCGWHKDCIESRRQYLEKQQQQKDASFLTAVTATL